jgi:uncharacterized membrane protein
MSGKVIIIYLVIEQGILMGEVLVYFANKNKICQLSHN